MPWQGCQEVKCWHAVLARQSVQLHVCCGVADVVAGVERPVAVGVAEVRRCEGRSGVIMLAMKILGAINSKCHGRLCS
jgi:hypothetical protein